jgi:hypothetical protein
MATPPPRPAGPLPIETPPDLQPTYANLARIAHAPTEFVLDFARFLPGDVKATVATRIVMSPIGIKLLLQALSENVARFEATFGTINVPSGSTTLADHLFRPFHGPPETPPPPEEKK